MFRQRFYVIGLSDEQPCNFAPDVLKVITAGKVFSGGKRHHEIVYNLLPDNHRWIDITVPLDNVFSAYEGIGEIVVFASGDPLFFGFANTILKRLPQADVKVYPFFNSLQMLAHRMALPYHKMKPVSLTGRPWDEFYSALINGEEQIGILTDRSKTPAVIAQRMLEYGYDNYTMTVGELLGNSSREQVRTFSLKDAALAEFAFPNCIILEQKYKRYRHFGIPESDFHLLDGRTKMITKAPIRLLTLSMLDLHNRAVLWDIGFCTGSISIEAKLQFPHLKVVAFEQRLECEEIIAANSRKFGTPGITVNMGDFMNADLPAFPAPDAVFIGGHGGKLKEILHKVNRVLLPGGAIVFNSVSESSRELFTDAIKEIGRNIVHKQHIAVDSFNPIEIMKAE